MEQKEKDVAANIYNKETDPFPRGTFISIVISLFSFFFAVNVIYPIVPFMVRDFFDISKDNTAQVGYYAGYLDSAFFVGTISSSILWGRLSDIYGRRPMILTGLFGTCLCALAFGASPNYGIALMIRFFWGAFDGNIGIVKTILGEIATKTNQARLYSILSIMGGSGRLCGNLVGGWLNTSIIDSNYKYLLPCLISAIVSFITFVVVFCLLEETNIAKKKQFFGQKGKGKAVDFGYDPNKDSKALKLKNAMVQVTALKWNKSKKYDKLQINEYDDDDDEDGGDTLLVVRNLNDSEDEDLGSSDEDEKQRKKLKAEGLRPTFYDRFAAPDETKPSVMKVFRKHNIYVSVLFYGMLSFLSAGYQSLFVVWVQSDKDEFGLDWNQSSIGTVSAIIGPIYVTFQLVFFVKYVQWRGYTKAAKYNLFIYMFMILLLPHLGHDVLRNSSERVQMGVICAYVSIAFSVRIMCFALSTVFINASTEPKERATAHGIGQTLGSLNKIVAPILLTNTFSWSVEFNVWPMNYCLAFYIQALVALIAVFWIHMMPSRDFEKLCQQFISKRKKKKKEPKKLKVDELHSDSDSSVR